MTPETKNSQLVLEGIKQGCFPRLVYKYRDASATTDLVFTSRTLWFARPSTFNDPFDCSLSETTAHTQLEVDAYVSNLTQRPEGKGLANIRQISVHDMQPILESAKTKVLDGCGVLCVSRKPDDILMWSHYARDHRGLALEFDMTEDPSFFSKPLNIHYTTSYTPTNYPADQQGTVETIITTKSMFWAYEEEVRIMKSGITGPVRFEPRSLKRVIFGLKTDPAYIEHVMQLCDTPELRHVEFAKMEKVYGAFALSMQPLKFGTKTVRAFPDPAATAAGVLFPGDVVVP